MSRPPDITPGFIPDIDLRPWRRQQRRAHRLRFWSLALAMLLLSTAALTITRTWVRSTLQQQALHAQQQRQQLELLRQRAVIPLESGAQLSGETLDWLRHWLTRRQTPVDSLLLLDRITPQTLALTRLHHEDGLMTISGHALSARDLNQFAEALSHSTRWQPTARLEASAALFDSTPVQSFTLETRLRETQTP